MEKIASLDQSYGTLEKMCDNFDRNRIGVAIFDVGCRYAEQLEYSGRDRALFIEWYMRVGLSGLVETISPLFNKIIKPYSGPGKRASLEIEIIDIEEHIRNANLFDEVPDNETKAGMLRAIREDLDYWDS